MSKKTSETKLRYYWRFFDYSMTNTTLIVFCYSCFLPGNQVLKFLNSFTSMPLRTNQLLINPIQDGLFRGYSRMGKEQKGPLPKICQTYPAMMKLFTVIPYQKKIQKLYESPDTPLEFCGRQHFFTGNHQILLYQEIQIETVFWFIISIYFNFSWVFIDCYNKHG